MIRDAYRCLLWMHPPCFRREFGGEMLWIYDESAPAGGVVALFLDGVVSLVRQWFVRSGYWKFAVALLGALFQVTLGGALMLRIGPSPARSSLSVLEHPEMAALLRLAAFTLIGLLSAVVLLVLWWRKLAAGRESQCSNCAALRNDTPLRPPSRMSASPRAVAKSPAT